MASDPNAIRNDRPLALILNRHLGNEMFEFEFEYLWIRGNQKGHLQLKKKEDICTK